MGLHIGGASELFGDNSFFAWCDSCHWNTVPARLKSLADAEYALAQHIETKRLLEKPLTAALIKVGQDHYPEFDVGSLGCACGWKVTGYPIGADTARELWGIHYTEMLKTTFRASVFMETREGYSAPLD